MLVFLERVNGNTPREGLCVWAALGFAKRLKFTEIIVASRVPAVNGFAWILVPFFSVVQALATTTCSKCTATSMPPCRSVNARIVSSITCKILRGVASLRPCELLFRQSARCGCPCTTKRVKSTRANVNLSIQAPGAQVPTAAMWRVQEQSH